MGNGNISQFVDNHFNKLLAGVALFLMLWIFKEGVSKLAAQEVQIRENQRCIAILQTDLANIKETLKRIDENTRK